jgi:stalled ribosome rescue protein Dom34
MKQFIIIAIAVIAFLIFKNSGKGTPDNSRVTELIENIEQLKSQIAILETKNDSFDNLKSQIAIATINATN